MKKLLSLLIALVMIAAALVACGDRAKGVDYLVLVNKENKLPDDWEQKLETVTVKNSSKSKKRRTARISN